jgi:hypothetical protein
VTSAGLAPGAGAAPTVTSVSASDVPGFCSFAGGFQTNIVASVDTLRVTVRQPSKRGGKLKLRVFVQQRQQTPFAQAYPSRILRGEVVVKVAGKRHRLIGPVNKRKVAGTIFPSGWTAKGSVAAPTKAKYKVTVRQVVYNVRGGGSGGWDGTPRGFDLVCSGGLDPQLRSTAYSAPRLTLRTPRALRS